LENNLVPQLSWCFLAVLLNYDRWHTCWPGAGLACCPVVLVYSRTHTWCVLLLLSFVRLEPRPILSCDIP
jgi:hypothetical protein